MESTAFRKSHWEAVFVLCKDSQETVASQALTGVHLSALPLSDSWTWTRDTSASDNTARDRHLHQGHQQCHSSCWGRQPCVPEQEGTSLRAQAGAVGGGATPSCLAHKTEVQGAGSKAADYAWGADKAASQGVKIQKHAFPLLFPLGSKC